MTVSVSVIICTYNRGGLLKRTLESLAGQTFPLESFEIIVVDDGSTDDTAEVCATFQADWPNFKYIRNSINSGQACARNLGIDSARGNHLLFTDDDCIVSNHWVERLNDYLSREDIVAGSIACDSSIYLEISENIGIFHAFMPGRKAGRTEFIPVANMSFRRSVFDKLKGFNPCLLRSDDLEIMLRARQNGYRAFFAPDAWVRHASNRKRLSSVFRHSFNQGRSAILLRLKYAKLLSTPGVAHSAVAMILFGPLLALKVCLDIYLKNSFARMRFFTFPIVYCMKYCWCLGAARELLNRQKDKLNCMK